MSELNLPTEGATAAHTNIDYILPDVQKKEPPVLLSLSKAIIVETIKDFFGSIIGFFLRYIKHFVRCLVYFAKPSLQKTPFNKLDYKQNAQHSFEFAIIALALVVFMEKLGWIPQTTSELMELYGNDLVQKFVELWFFILFAALYLLSAAVSIFSGRLLRRLFKPSHSRDESDILFSYLNNSFFSISAVAAFALRCMAAMATHDEESLNLVLASIFLPTVAIGMLLWSFRFPYLHKMKTGKGILFGVTGFIFYTCFYVLVGIVIGALFLGI